MPRRPQPPPQYRDVIALRQARTTATAYCVSDDNVNLYKSWLRLVLDDLSQGHANKQPVADVIRRLNTTLLHYCNDENLVTAVFAHQDIEKWNAINMYSPKTTIFDCYTKLKILRSQAPPAQPTAAVALNASGIRYKDYNKHGDFLYRKHSRSSSNSDDKNRNRDSSRSNIRFSRPSRSDYRSHRRSFSRSNDRHNRSFSRDRRPFSNNRRSYSRDRRSPSRSKSRDFRSNSRQSRSSSRYGRRKNRHFSRSASRHNSRSMSRSKSRNGRFSNYSSKIRNRSASVRRLYPDFKPGYNCRPDYDINKKSCTKCNDHFDAPRHHEFECSNFTVYSKTPCPSCRRGNHLPKECDKQFLN